MCRVMCDYNRTRCSRAHNERKWDTHDGCCSVHGTLFGLPVTLHWPDTDTGGGGGRLYNVRVPLDRTRFAGSRARVVMLDSVRCLMSAVMASPSSERPADGVRRGLASQRRSESGGSKRKVRVHRISSRYPAVEVRTRMDSYGTGVRAAAAASNAAEVDDVCDGAEVVVCGAGGSSSTSSSSSTTSSASSASDTAAGCSSVSDTDFYYEDRTDDAGLHTTVIELRAEHVDRTETVQEEFQDSLMPGYDDDHLQLQQRHVRRRTVEVVTKHRHVLSESCRVKVENLRYYADARTRKVTTTTLRRYRVIMHGELAEYYRRHYYKS